MNKKKKSKSYRKNRISEQYSCFTKKFRRIKAQNLKHQGFVFMQNSNCNFLVHITDFEISKRQCDIILYFIVIYLYFC